MSNLTKSVQNCGIHDTCENHNCFAISEKEAQRAIAVVKQACIDAVRYKYKYSKIYSESSCEPAIQAIRDVK